LTPPGSPYQIESFNVPYVAGGRLLWETPLEGLRLGGSLQELRLDATVLAGPDSVGIQIPAVLSVGSIEYAAGDLVLAAEYSRWGVGLNSSDSKVFPTTSTTTSERAYAMATYRASRWLQPGVYYSLLFPDVDNRSGRENYQHDIATTLRFDISSHWLVKLEGHYMFGTAGLDPTLNDNTPLTQLAPAWSVLLVKTTAYF
jgi:hypothetical protein